MFNTQEELISLSESSKIVGKVLNSIKESILGGERELSKLDNLASALLEEFGAKSAFKGYQPDFADSPFQYHICASVNNEVVHGLPSEGRFLQDGDIVTIDLGASYNGWCADSAFTIGIGEISDNDRLLIETTERCFNEAAKLCYPGNTLGDIGNAITTIAEFNNFYVAFALSGHGIGKELHEQPAVYNFGKPGSGPVIEVGMSFCIEPIIIAGTSMISEENNGISDGWTIYSADGSKAAHYEHTIAITEDGPLILTRI